jgi:hypothetical protein
MSEADPTLQRLEDQINWYDRKSNYNQRVYKGLKVIEIVAAALVPLAAGLHLPAVVTGSLGVLIAVLEGLLQLNQYQHNAGFVGKRDHARCEALIYRRLSGQGLAWLTVRSTIWRVNSSSRIAWNLANKEHGRNVVSETHLQ